MRVLIADADERLLDVLQSYLWDQGHEVEVAANALECMVVLREFQPEVLVLEHDLLWGGTDGVLAVLSEQPLVSHVPVILVGDSNLSCEGLPCRGIAGSLRKPFRLADLLRLVETVPMGDQFVLAVTVHAPLGRSDGPVWRLRWAVRESFRNCRILRPFLAAGFGGGQEGFDEAAAAVVMAVALGAEAELFPDHGVAERAFGGVVGGFDGHAWIAGEASQVFEPFEQVRAQRGAPTIGAASALIEGLVELGVEDVMEL